jgi:peptide/nickel transport system substrate-binding protein
VGDRRPHHPRQEPNYFKSGRPYLDKVIFYFRQVDESRIQGLRSGELNWVDAIPLQQVNTLKTDPAFNFVTASNAGIPDFIAFNNGAPPFDNKGLRQAVAWAMDRMDLAALPHTKLMRAIEALGTFVAPALRVQSAAAA